MSELTAEPLCVGCDSPTIMLELVKPFARKREGKDMLPMPKYKKEVAEKIEVITDNLVELVCHRNDRARFEHKEWLLSGDGDVNGHKYYLVRDCIYSAARVDR